jgi:hypothetical protein
MKAVRHNVTRKILRLIADNAPGWVNPTGYQLEDIDSIAVQDRVFEDAPVPDIPTPDPVVPSQLGSLLYDPSIQVMQVLGSAIKAQTFGLNLALANTAFTPADGILRFTAVYLPMAENLTGIAIVMRIQGNFIADNNNKLALYSYNNGIMTKVAESANDPTTIWKGAVNTFVKVPFAGGPYSAVPGVYFVAALYNNSAQTTAPVLAGGVNMNNAIQASLDLTKSAKISATVAAQLDMPVSQAMSGVISSANLCWFGLY